ncbi:glycosyltransferase family 4 protein [Halosimplex pelagicum]|uniref:Glycosyltransferase family 4 protein n=1 Tax=Halosimplex pelagicum TaxID=869886 RepID=A0A7D5PAU3_9EURY|nr:glycosyltransferase family 4 protein [Halosimplex pelagicum]QLH81258.1 glycosyltransferase family 4 protein [Halosimplex pelagicum]
MRVAFVSNVVYPFVTGGAEKRIYEIGRRLSARGHDVTVYGRHYWDGPAEMEYEGMTLRAVAPDRDLYTADRRSITEAVDFAARATPTLVRRAGDHDVLVASVFPFFPVLSARLAASLGSTPLVTTWHEVWREYWREYLGSPGLAGMAVERTVANIPQRPVAVSDVTADRLAGLGVDRDRITVVPNGVDIDRIRSIPPATDGYDIVFAGRLVPEKRVDRLIRAFATADVEATLGIIGDGPERDRLEQLAVDSGVAGDVDFLGFLPESDDVLAQFRSADIFATASTREGFGITTLEALAADCTVVATDHPRSAAAEVVGDAGFLVAPSASALAAGLETACSGERPSLNPRERAAAFDWDRVTDDAEQVYEAACSLEG